MNWRGKRITVMGLGLLGRGLNVTKFLAEEGAKLTVTDLKSADELRPSLTKLEQELAPGAYRRITWALGEHRLEDFRNRDMVLKAAGVPLDSPYIAEAKKSGIPVEMDASLFARLTGATLIGVTGTRGKSTTTYALYEILNAFLKGKAWNVYLGGNVRDTATLPLLRKARAGDLVVLELDSWQLQGFGDAKLSPHIAVFVSFMPDHMNYYRNDLERYFRDKANIFAFQDEGDYLVTNDAVREIIQRYGIPVPGTLRIVSGTECIDTPLPGAHNRKDLAHAAEAARTCGVDEKTIETALRNFRGLPGRLERIAEKNGIAVYNDTNATMPDATLAALEALGKDGNIVLIMGGADKELDMSRLIGELHRYCKALVLLPGTGTERIKGELEPLHPVVARTMDEAVRRAFEAARKGDTILLSPAFASFGLFKNEYNRGDRFNEAVAKI